MSTLVEIASVFRQIQEARTAHYKAVLQIRVTTFAIPGSIAVVQVTDERARIVGPRLDEGWRPGKPLHEILIHPEDWKAILKSVESRSALDVSQRPIRLLGLPVEES